MGIFSEVDGKLVGTHIQILAPSYLLRNTRKLLFVYLTNSSLPLSNTGTSDPLNSHNFPYLMNF